MRWIPVAHEVERQPFGAGRGRGWLCRDATKLLGRTWVNDAGESRPIGWGDILVIAPYNAQVAALAERLGLSGTASAPWTSSRAARRPWQSTP